MAVDKANSNSSSFSYLQYKNKIGGLVSGMDIDSMMEKIMKSQSAQMEKLQQEKQKYEWKRDAYRSVNTALSAFERGLFDNYGLSKNWASKSVTNSDTSNRATITANGSANGNLEITQATKASAATSGVLTADSLVQTRVTESTTLDSLVGSNATGGKIFDLDLSGSTSLKNVLDELKNNGYTAAVSGGKISVAAGADAKALDASTKAGLEKLGVSTFNFNQVSSKLTFGADNKTASASTKLSDLGVTENGTMKINVAGEQKEVAYSADDTLATLMKKVNSETGLSASITDGALTFSSSSNKTFSISDAPSALQFKDSLKASVGSTLYSNNVGNGAVKGSNTLAELTGQDELGTGSFVLRSIDADGNGKDTTISYKNTDTIDSLMSKISSSATGVTAIFNNGKLSISANNTGKREDGGPEVGIVRNGSDLGVLSALGVNTSGTGDEITVATGGTNASATINGIDYEQRSNNFTVAGYTVVLNQNIAAGDSIKVSSSDDADDLIKKTKEFVETYNGLIKSLNSQLTEKKQLAYQPLTEAQKSVMSEDQIKKWEEQSKKGIIKNDGSIREVLAKMRETLYSGQGSDTLYNVGITTTKTWSDGGMLEVNEDKLKAALEKDPAVLQRIFIGTSDGNKGAIRAMRDAAQSAVKSIEKSAGKESMSEETYSLGKNIKDISSKIKDWQERLKGIEARYWKQFGAMEKAVQRSNSQSSMMGFGQ